MSILEIEEIINDIDEEILLIKRRFSLAHSLGDSNSAKGISATYADQQFWSKKLTSLKSRKKYFTQLKAAREGNGKIPFTPGMVGTNIV